MCAIHMCSPLQRPEEDAECLPLLSSALFQQGLSSDPELAVYQLG